MIEQVAVEEPGWVRWILEAVRVPQTQIRIIMLNRRPILVGLLMR